MLRLIPSAVGSPLSRRMIAAVDTDSPREVFFRVASEMFSDGNFNWGRVVALFYFASKLVLKVGGCRIVSRRRPPQTCRGPGRCDVNPCGNPGGPEGDGSEPDVLHSYIHPRDIYWAYYVPSGTLHPGCSTKQSGLGPCSQGAHISEGC